MILVIKKKALILTAIIAVIALAVTCTLCNKSVIAAMSAKKKVPIYSVQTEEKVVALTFDAAWGADKTNKIMDVLDEYGMKATFFLVGFWIDAYPELVKEIHDRGFHIGNHSTTHPHFNRLSLAEQVAEIQTTNKKIEQITGTRTRFFRAPFGEYNDKLLGYLESDEAGMQCIQWDVDTLDWKGISGKDISERVLCKFKNGSIILCHNNSEHILDALPIILLGLKNKGYTSVTLDKLVYADGYRIDNNGLQTK